MYLTKKRCTWLLKNVRQVDMSHMTRAKQTLELIARARESPWECPKADHISNVSIHIKALGNLNPIFVSSVDNVTHFSTPGCSFSFPTFILQSLFQQELHPITLDCLTAAYPATSPFSISEVQPIELWWIQFLQDTQWPISS